MNTRLMRSKSWIIDITLQISNSEGIEESSEGFGIYYLKQVPRADPKSQNFVINKPFDGFGLIFDTYVKTPGMPPETNKVYAITNDDTKENIDPFRDHISEWAALYKNSQKVDMRLKYDHTINGGLFMLQTKLESENEYTEWMRINEINLSYEGFLVIYGSNGEPNTDHVNIYSIEAYDPTRTDKTRVSQAILKFMLWSFY